MLSPAATESPESIAGRRSDRGDKETAGGAKAGSFGRRQLGRIWESWVVGDEEEGGAPRYLWAACRGVLCGGKCWDWYATGVYLDIEDSVGGLEGELMQPSGPAPRAW
jgi:hypothetical protein